MSESDKPKKGMRQVIIVSLIILAVLAIWAIKRQLPSELTLTDYQPNLEAATDSNLPKLSLDEIINHRDTWNPAFTSWYGKPAPDFTLTDTKGNQHKLSDYRGKNVLLVFWATWCGPCIIEIPHLVALRNIMNEDKLAMLAISSENPRLVKDFTAKRNLNYTVLHANGSLLEPFNTIEGIPCSFFIDPAGNVKFATMGLISLGQTKAIILAE